MVAPNIPVMTELSVEDQQPSPSLAINRSKNAYAIDIDNIDIDPDEPALTTPPISGQTQSLEERVAELESKLATLSHLLAVRTSSQSSTPPQLLSGSLPDSPSLSSTCPPLDSPHPSTGMRRRLSGILLRDEESSPRPTLHFPDLTAEPDNDDPSDDDDKKPAGEESVSVRQKWLDYLESFQESTPNVDVQMQEFVRVPSQLESLLTFGLCICVDSYLYILTMLPIKFVWAVTLLFRSLFSKQGKIKYHRR
jgi:hypothetical protein